MQDQLTLKKYSIELTFEVEILPFLEEQAITHICAYRPPESWYDTQYHIYPFTAEYAEKLNESIWVVCPILSKEVLDMDNSIEGLEFKIHLTQELFSAYQQSNTYGR